MTALRTQRKYTFGSDRALEMCVYAITNKTNGNKYLSSYEASLATGVDKDKIGNVCTGKRKSTGGLVFWYEVQA